MSGYIMDLRRIVGHRTLLQCAGSVIIINQNGELLLQKRSDNGLWGYAGGSVEIDERVEDCARRELLEETGLIAGEMELFMISSGPEVHYVYPNGDEVSNVEIIYICRDYSGELAAQKSEVDELRFFAPRDIDIEMISPPIRPVFREYFNRFGIDRSKTEQKALDMPFEKVYACLEAKAVKKGRSREELDEITAWLTGYAPASLEKLTGSYGSFLENAPAWNEKSRLVTGTVCGVRVEEIRDPLVYRMRCLDKMVDELAKGRETGKIKRA